MTRGIQLYSAFATSRLRSPDQLRNTLMARSPLLSCLHSPQYVAARCCASLCVARWGADIRNLRASGGPRLEWRDVRSTESPVDRMKEHRRRSPAGAPMSPVLWGEIGPVVNAFRAGVVAVHQSEACDASVVQAGPIGPTRLSILHNT